MYINVYVYIDVHIHVYIHKYVSVDIYIYIYIIHTHTHTYIYIYTHARTHTHTHTHKLCTLVPCMPFATSDQNTHTGTQHARTRTCYLREFWTPTYTDTRARTYTPTDIHAH
jgi:hypothetical protein